MAISDDQPDKPYHCYKCGNYYYHMNAGVYFTQCPDCDFEPSDEDEAYSEDEKP